MKKVTTTMSLATLTAILATGVFTAGCAKNTTVENTDTATGTVKTAGTKVSAPKQDYIVPSKDVESVTVELTLDGDTIIDYKIDYVANHAKSKGYQKAFADKIGEKIVGKSVKGLKVWVVNGASLTSKAFEDSLVNIESQLQ